MRFVFPKSKVNCCSRGYFILLCLCLLCINLGIIFYFFNLKTGMHSDELWSYAHANSTQGAFLSDKIDSFFDNIFDELAYKNLNAKTFHDYITVQPEEQFRYAHIWTNMANDVHPPFYFVVLHTICSFFPETFSKWYAASFNICLWVWLLYLMFKLSRRFFNDDLTALMPVVLYAFSRMSFNTVLFLRMYVLQTFLAVGLLYQTILLLQENKADKKRLFWIYLCSSLGLLTHYNSLFLSFFTAVVTCLLLFWRRHWQLLFSYAVVMWLSAMTLFVVFPDAWFALFYSQRGEQALFVGNMFLSLDTIYIFDNKVTVLFRGYLCELLSFSVSYIKSLLFFWIFCGLFFYYKEYRGEKKIGAITAIVLLTTFCLGLLMPAGRYCVFLGPVWAILTVYLIYQVMTAAQILYRVKITVLIMLVAVNAYFVRFSEKGLYLFQNDEATQNYVQAVSGKNVMLYFEYAAALYGQSAVFQNANRIMLVPSDCSERALAIADEFKGGILLARNVKVRGSNVSYIPERIDLACPALEERLSFVATVHTNEIFYDFYWIK